MDRLTELYSQYDNFSAYRSEALQSIDEENNRLRLRIQELELEKKQAQLEFDRQIHELKTQISTTRGKAQANEQLTREKAELKKELHAEIAKVHSHGNSPREIADYLGLSSTTLIYQAIKNSKPVFEEAQKDAVDYVYFDNAAVHRYAVSEDRKFVKVHGTEDKYKIVSVDGFHFISGDKDINVNAGRLQTALKMFDGEDVGEYIVRKNPYADREAA